MSDLIEFYTDGNNLIASVFSSFRFKNGDKVNILGTTYKVSFVAFALDNSQFPIRDRIMRQNIDLEKCED